MRGGPRAAVAPPARGQRLGELAPGRRHESVRHGGFDRFPGIRGSGPEGRGGRPGMGAPLGRGVFGFPGEEAVTVPAADVRCPLLPSPHPNTPWPSPGSKRDSARP